MKKFKVKIDVNSTIEDINQCVKRVLLLKTKYYELSIIKKLLFAINVKELKSRGGSAIRFYHKALEEHPYYTHGIFSIHKIHKGGSKGEIRRSDFEKYLLPPIHIIIEHIVKERKDS